MKQPSAKQYAARLWRVWSKTPKQHRQTLLLVFLQLLQRRRSLRLLPRILDQLQTLADRAAGLTRVRVATASPIDPAILSAELERQFGPVALDMTVQPELIAGLNIRVGDRLIDASTARALRQLRTSLTHA